jgi:hypothetical protein
MSATTVRISQESYRVLRDIADQTDQTMRDVLDQALETYRRQLFFERLNAGYAALRADPKAWGKQQAERKLWEATLPDGLGAGERWTEDGRCLNDGEG